MDKFDRIYQLHSLLEARKTPVPIRDIMSRLECSEATAFRIIKAMKDYLNAPIQRVDDPPGYRYQPVSEGGAYQLPGLWFSARELQALALLQKLIHGLGPGLLEAHLSPLAERLDEMMAHKRLSLSEAGSRIRILSLAARPTGDSFEIAASATLQRRKLRFQYRSRSKDELTDRVVSPQRLAHYRDNWYLDAWDELRQSLRSFSVDRIHAPLRLDEAAVDRPVPELDEYFASSYGIFAGRANNMATLRFSRQHPPDAFINVDSGFGR